MIEFDTSRGAIVRGEVNERIKRWDVWFQTPFGLCTTLDEAVAKVKELDMNPNMVIIPIPIAVSESTHEAYFR